MRSSTRFAGSSASIPGTSGRSRTSSCSRSCAARIASRKWSRAARLPRNGPTSSRTSAGWRRWADVMFELVLLTGQMVNGLQFGFMLFLIAAGLTLVFGIMDFANLAHGALFMLGAYLAAGIFSGPGNFLAAVGAGVVGTAVIG